MPLLVGPALPPGHLAGLTQPVLTTGDLTVRPWRADDLPAVVAEYADPDIQQWHVRSMTTAEARAWVEHWPGRRQDETGAGWAVDVAGAVVGQVSLRDIDLTQACVEISYWVLPGSRGRGVASAALQAVTEWASMPAWSAQSWPTRRPTLRRAGSRPRPASCLRAPLDGRCCTLTAGTTCTSTPACVRTRWTLPDCPAGRCCGRQILRQTTVGRPTVTARR